MTKLRIILVVLVLGMIAPLLAETVFRSLLGVVPNFSLILVVYLAFHEVTVFGVFLAFLVGLELDLSHATLVGPWAGTFSILLGLFAFLAQKIFVQSTLVVALAVFFSTFVGVAVHFGMECLYVSIESVGFATMFFEAILNALLSPIIFRLLKKIVASSEGMGATDVGRYFSVRAH